MNIKSTNINIDNRTREYLDKKLELLGKFVNLNAPNTTLDVELGRTTRHHKKGDVFKAELNLMIDGELYRAEEEMEDLFSAIDMAVEELAKQLRRGKGKRETLFKKGGRKIKDILRKFNPKG